MEALPWQQFGLAYGELTALTPDTLNDENGRETGEAAASPDVLKGAPHSRPVSRLDEAAAAKRLVVRHHFDATS